MANMNIFKNDAFSMVSMTNHVKKMPYIPSTIRDSGLFEPKPIRTTGFWVEVRDGKITLVPTSNRGAPIWQNAKQKREAVYLETVRLAKGDRITADEIQNVRAEGEEALLKEIAMEVSDRQEILVGDIDLTEENLMLGALQGVLVDADGSTTIYDLFNKFGITKPAEIDFDLDNASPSAGALITKCNEVVRGMTRAAGGSFTTETEICAYVGDAFWDNLVSHTEVKSAYNDWMKSQSFSNQVGAFGEFKWGGIVWKNYRGTDDGSTVSIGTDKAKFFPRRARGIFQTAIAPAETMQYVNTRGLPRYSRIIPDTQRDEWVDVEVMAYLLPYCTRPEVLYSARRT